MKTLEENNKLIAEFMNVDQVDIDTYLETNEELKYHTSWDWLMPVVEKCYNDIAPLLDGIDDDGQGAEHLIGDVTQALLDVQINDTFNFVVRCIEWYNNNEQV